MAEEAEAEPDAVEGSDLIAQVERLNAAAAKGFMNALLTPPFTVFGNRLGEWAERVAGKRRENIQAHVDAVKAKNPDVELGNSAGQQQDLFEWAREAGRYGEADQEAELWRGILDAILTNSSSQKRILRIAEELNGTDIELLFDVAKIKKSTDDTKLTKLINLGLLNYRKKITPLLAFFTICTLLFIFLTIFSAPIQARFSLLQAIGGFDDDLIVFVPALVSMLNLVFIFWLFNVRPFAVLVNEYSLTADAETILDYWQRYAEPNGNRPHQHESGSIRS